MSAIELLFIYNADSGLLNTAKDFVHKIVSPETYECNLCAVTYGNIGMKGEWKSFIEDLDYPVEFLHRDEFEDKYAFDRADYPSALVKRNGNLEYFITAEEMNELTSLGDLISLVQKRVVDLNP